MSNYPLKVNKYNWRSLEPQTNLCYTEDYIADHYDLYLTACETASVNWSSHRLESTSWTRLSSAFTRIISRVRFPMSVLPRCPRITRQSRKRSNAA